MALDFSRIGATTAPVTHTHTWKDVVGYALSVGAKVGELDYLYEARGPRVLPSYAVIPAWEALMAAMAGAGLSFDKVVHGHQKVSSFAPIPPEATLSTTATIAAIYDMKKMAQVVVVTSTTDASGKRLCETEWGIIVFGEGGWGGEAPPGREGGIPSRPADFRIEEATTPEQALFYRLAGDGNPLHADPDFPLVRERFQGRPILHGLCTYGFLTRAIAKGACHGDAGRIQHIEARFTKPVWPGDTLVTEGWVEGEKVFARTSTLERGEPVLSHARATLSV